jgi:pre-60S factor REI1
MKCNTCLASFPTMEVIKDHYKSEWHCFNSKRRAQNLPILRREQFLQLVKTAETKSPPKSAVMTIKKDHNAHDRVEVPMAKSPEKVKEESISEKTVIHGELVEGEQQSEDVSELASELESTKQKYKPVLGAAVSVFDDKIFSTSEETVDYMTMKYGFFIPDIEYLTDLDGLIEYLNEKVKEGCICLFCQKRFADGRATQHHMISKSHCKIAYDESTGDVDELEDFYDFSSTYEDIEEEIDENGEVIEEEAHPGATGELVLPGGKILGHRMFRRYYKQYYPPQDTREPILAQQREELLRLGMKFGTAAIGGEKGGDNNSSGSSLVTRVNEMSEIEVMTHLIRYQKEIRKGQIQEQRGKMRRENLAQRREYKSNIEKLRSSETTTAKIRDYHKML